MWVSFQVNIVAISVSLFIGIPLGFWVAHRQGTWIDPFVVTSSLVLMSIPIMVSIPLVLWVLCLKASLVPCSGWGGIFDLRIIVPAITMGLPGVAGFVRLMRASTLDVLGQDFVRTAHSKGLNPRIVDYRHVARNALIPIVTILAMSFAGILTTSFITERLLGIPGVGDFAIQSIFNPIQENLTHIFTENYASIFLDEYNNGSTIRIHIICRYTFLCFILIVQAV